MKQIFTPRQKAAIALEALKGLKTANQLAGEYQAHPVQVGMWKGRLAKEAHQVFSGETSRFQKHQQELIERLYKVIGQRDIEIEWLKKKLHLES